MPSTKEIPKIPLLDATPYEKVLHLRGVEYHLRELSANEYDELNRKATTIKNNAVGDEYEYVDRALLLKTMVMKCCTSPRLTIDRYAELPVPVAFKLNDAVNHMHYDEMPEDKSEDTEGDDKGEG